MFTKDEIMSFASSLDTKVVFKDEGGVFVDLGVDFTIVEDMLIMRLNDESGWDDEKDFIDTIEEEIGFSEYNFDIIENEIVMSK